MRLIFVCITGSYLYGTNRPDSDIDIRGVCLNPIESLLGFTHFEQYLPNKDDASRFSFNNFGISSDDVQIYGLNKFLQLALAANPNIIELLFADNLLDSIQVDTYIWKKILDNRDSILSTRVIHTFSGYAYSQLQRIKGHKRWIDSPPHKPIPEDYGMEQTAKGGQRWTDSNKYNQYQSLLKDYQQYQTWLKERNPARQELEIKYGYDCYSEDTEFLTDNGWKLYDDITERDKLATVNSNLEMEYQDYFERVKKYYSGIMYNIKSIDTNCLVTPNHRVFLSEKHRGATKKYQDKYYFNNLYNIINSPKSYYSILTMPDNINKDYDVEDWYLELVGAYISEGTSLFRNNRFKEIRITQTPKGKLEFFDMMMRISQNTSVSCYNYLRKNRNYNETVWVIGGEVGKRVYNDCGHLSHNKRLPRWIQHLSKRQARVLLNAMILGDGTTRKTSHIYHTNNKLLAGDTQELALLACMNANVYQTGYNMYLVGIRHYKTNYKNTVVINNNLPQVDYSGNIVCFSVPNETLITRRCGKISIQGNTKHAMHIIRLLLEAEELLSTGKITFPFTGSELAYLLDVLHGEYTYESILETGEKAKDYLLTLEPKSILPKKPNVKKIEDLLIDINLENIRDSNFNYW